MQKVIQQQEPVKSDDYFLSDQPKANEQGFCIVGSILVLKSHLLLHNLSPVIDINNSLIPHIFYQWWSTSLQNLGITISCSGNSKAERGPAEGIRGYETFRLPVVSTGARMTRKNKS